MGHEIVEFLFSVLDHLFFWFGGIALVIIETLKKITRTKVWAERLRLEFWIIAAVCIFIATIQAWHDEFKRAEAFSSSNSQLTGENNSLRQERDSLTNKLIDKERPTIVQTTPDPQIGELLKRFEEDEKKYRPSPRKAALKLSTDILKFYQDKLKSEPPIPQEAPGMTQEQLKDAQTKYELWGKSVASEYVTRFGSRTRSLIDDMLAANFDPAGGDVPKMQNDCSHPPENGSRLVRMMEYCGSRIGAIAEKLPK